MRRRAAEKTPFHVVLLAGGSGTRFWPMSRARRPKQFLPLVGDEPLIAGTWRRVAALAPPERIWVVAPQALAADVRRSLGDLRRDRMILEPSPRDTAPAIGLACATIRRAAPDAVVGVFPTDHVVRDTGAFGRAVRAARDEATRGALVCLGVRPDRPATGFGYLKCGATPRAGHAMDVLRFVEKPDAPRARRFLRSGKYLWNGGMFVWRAERFLEELGRHEPATRAAVEAVAAGRGEAWERAARRSVDYAVMEKARGVRVVALDAGWDDVGSWDAAARLREESGAGGGRDVAVDSEGSVVFGGGRVVALVGVPGVIVVDTDDALLIAARDRTEDVRKVVEALRARADGKLL